MEFTNQPAPDTFTDPSAMRPRMIPLGPDNPPWNSLVAVGVWIFSVLAIAIIPIFFVIPYMLSAGKDLTQTQALGEFLLSDKTAVLLQVIAIIPAHILTIALAWIVVTRMRTYSFREMLGWRSGGTAWWHYVVLLLGILALATIVGYFVPEQETELIRILKSSPAAVYTIAFMATFTAPLVEEVVYRGILYSAFQRAVGVWAAVAIVTFLFALVHVPQYYESLSTMFLLLVLSLALTLMRVWSGNLLPCVIFHTIFNGIQSIGLIVGPYTQTVEPVIDPVKTAFLR